MHCILSVHIQGEFSPLESFLGTMNGSLWARFSKWPHIASYRAVLLEGWRFPAANVRVWNPGSGPTILIVSFLLALLNHLDVTASFITLSHEKLVKDGRHWLSSMISRLSDSTLVPRSFWIWLCVGVSPSLPGLFELTWIWGGHQCHRELALLIKPMNGRLLNLLLQQCLSDVLNCVRVCVCVCVHACVFTIKFLHILPQLTRYFIEIICSLENVL
jgi:hypothetical protein